MKLSKNKRNTKKTKPYGDCLNRKKIMSYKDVLKKQIAELQKQIEEKQGDKVTLEAQLNKLLVAEFEEEMATENTQTLLKG